MQTPFHCTSKKNPNTSCGLQAFKNGGKRQKHGPRNNAIKARGFGILEHVSELVLMP